MSLWHFLTSPPLHPSFTNMNCIWPGRCCRVGRHSSTLHHSLECWLYFPSIRIKSEHHSWDWSHFFSLSPRSRFHSKGQGDRLAAAYLMHMDDGCSICSVAECKYSSLFPCSFSASDSDRARHYMVSLVGHINAKLQKRCKSLLPVPSLPSADSDAFLSDNIGCNRWNKKR